MNKYTALLLCSFFTATAWGQSYVRPSKGKALTVIGPQRITTTTQPIYSAVYDFSAFEAVELLLEYRADCFHVFSVYGGYTPNGPFTRTTVLDPNAVNENFAWDPISSVNRSRAYTVSNLPPYIKFRLSGSISDQPWTSPLLCPEFYGATAVPLAFAPRKTASSDQALGAATISSTAPVLVGGGTAAGPIKALALESRGGLLVGGYANTASKIVPNINSTQTTYIVTGLITPTTPSISTLQNMGTVPVFCSISISAPTTTSYNFVLAGGSAPNDGLGRSITLRKSITAPQCVTASGTSSILLREFW